MSLLLRLSCILGLAAGAMAADFTFVGADNADWNQVSSWTNVTAGGPATALPTAADNVTIPVGKKVSFVSPPDPLDLQAKTVTCAGTINLNAGSGRVSLIIQDSLNLTGTLNLGSANVIATLDMAGTAPSITGTGTIVVAKASFGSFSRVAVATGETCSVSSGVTISGGTFQLVQDDVSASVVTRTKLQFLAGSTLNLGAEGSIESEAVDLVNDGAMILASSAHISLSNARFTQSSSGALTVSIGSASGRAFIDQMKNTLMAGQLTVNLDAGFQPNVDAINTILEVPNDPAGAGSFTLTTGGVFGNLIVNEGVNPVALQVTFLAKSQSVQFTLPSTLVVGGADVTLPATSTQTVPVGYSVELVENVDGTTTGSAASVIVAGNKLRIGNVAEKIKVKATAPQATVGSTLFAADSAFQLVTIQQPQSITVSPVPANPKKGDTFTLTATPAVATWLGSAVGVTWATSNASVATVDGAGLVTIVDAGPVTLTASTAAIDPYLKAGTKATTFTAFKSQVVQITSPANPFTVPFTITPTTITATHESSSGAGTWTSSNTAVAQVAKVSDVGGIGTATLTYVGQGTTNIVYSVPGDGTFLAGSVTLPVTVTAGTGTVTISPVSPLNVAAGTGPTTITGNHKSSSVAGVWASSNPSVATVAKVNDVAGGNSDATLTFGNPGTTNITFTVPGDANFSAGVATLIVNVALRDQTVTITSPASPASLPFSVTPTTVTATHQSTSTTGTWSSSDTTVATVGTFTDAAGTATAKITYLKLGTTTITFTSPADSTFKVGTATLALTVTQNTTPIKPTVTFPDPPATIVANGADVTLGATSTGSLLVNYVVTFKENPDGTTTTAKSTVIGSLLHPGTLPETVTITATAVGGTSAADGLLYSNSDPVAKDVVIHQPQVITLSGFPAQYDLGSTYTLVATPSTTTFQSTPVTVAWTSSNTGVATIGSSSGVLAVAGFGTTTLTASTNAVGKYLLATTKTIVIDTTPVVAKPVSDGASGGGGGCGSGGGVAVLLGGLALALRPRARGRR